MSEKVVINGQKITKIQKDRISKKIKYSRLSNRQNYLKGVKCYHLNFRKHFKFMRNHTFT